MCVHSANSSWETKVNEPENLKIEEGTVSNRACVKSAEKKSLKFPKKKKYPKDRVWTRGYCDTLFAKWIKERDKHTCVLCGKKNVEIEAAHYHDRGYKNTRYDPDNVYTLCAGPMGCHSEADNRDRRRFTSFMISVLGHNGYTDLQLKADTMCTMLQARQRFQQWYQNQ